MKLKSIELGFSSCLYEIKLHFTNGVVSAPMKTQFAGAKSRLRRFNLDLTRRIADVYINQGDPAGNIYGFRILDEFGEYIINEQWHSGAT